MILEHNTYTDMTAIFGPEGHLARCLQGFEARPGQVEMAAAVAAALVDGGRLVVEAGTGIGKTLAYLVPALISGKKVVVSTNTLTLQDQIAGRDLPFLKQHLFPELAAITIKGRQNYLCLRRWRQLAAGRGSRLFGADGELAALRDWLGVTETGERAELDWLPDDSALWQEVNSSAGRCLGMHCPEAGDCFIARLRRRAARARLLIVNHHLFFSDLAIRRTGYGEVLPRYEAVVFDEAHHLESVATTYFGLSFGLFQLAELSRDLETQGRVDLKGKRLDRLMEKTGALLARAERLLVLFPKEPGRYPLFETVEAIPGWQGEKDRTIQLLEDLAQFSEEAAISGEAWPGYGARARTLAGNLADITEERRSSHVCWVERRERTVTISASPIDIAGELQDLYREARGLVFASATLATGGNFAYFLDRLGLPPDTETLTVPTPFDYANRTLLYVPAAPFPDPAAPAFAEAAQQAIEELLHASRGRALLLFTSLRAMRGCYERLVGRLDGSYPLLVQGSASKKALLERFQAETHSVLLAVASFWEGVDVPGEALSLVVIDKLPFEVPSDPVMMARMDRVREEGGNPFMDFQTPRAILALRQGVGRLMRRADDHGVIAILDVRLFTKQYGRLFLASLPPSPLTRSLAQVAAFFAGETLPE